jgi:LysM repeat protein
MTHRTPARWLAPLALVGAAVAIAVTVKATSSNGGGGTATSTSGAPSSTAPTTTTAAATTATTTTPAAGRTYTVQPGDVLSAIAEKTGVALTRIEALNPDVDAQSLHAGQKIKLAP